MLIVLSFLSLAGQVHGEAGDIYEVYAPMQMYAPVQIEIRFEFTRTRAGDWKPQGFATGASVETGVNFLRFKAVENDTYWVWFLVTYDQPIHQNITVVYQEGSRPPVARPALPMFGQSIYFEWVAIQVIPEPRFPSEAAVWNYGRNDLTTLGNTMLAEIARARSDLFWGMIRDVVIAGFVLGVGWKVRGLDRKIRGRG